MVWSWSHTQEAYDNARENLFRLDREELNVIFAEWRAAQGRHGIINPVCPQFSDRKYHRALKFARTMPDDIVADFIWAQSSEWSTCDNGGYNAWVCPYGCHTVSFDCDIDHEARISTY